MSDPLTAEEVEQVRSFHSAKDPDGIICNCGMFTPCHAQRLIATIDRAAPPSDAAAPLREALERIVDAFHRDNIRPAQAAFLMVGIADAALTADAPSEYGRLLAERDRLIASGVDPADLDLPDAPTADTPKADLSNVNAMAIGSEAWKRLAYMCPNCVTPWKCNGPHIPEGEA